MLSVRAISNTAIIWTLSSNYRGISTVREFHELGYAMFYQLDVSRRSGVNDGSKVCQ